MESVVATLIPTMDVKNAVFKPSRILLTLFTISSGLKPRSEERRVGKEC